MLDDDGCCRMQRKQLGGWWCWVEVGTGVSGTKGSFNRGAQGKGPSSISLNYPATRCCCISEGIMGCGTQVHLKSGLDDSRLAHAVPNRQPGAIIRRLDRSSICSHHLSCYLSSVTQLITYCTPGNRIHSRNTDTAQSQIPTLDLRNPGLLFRAIAKHSLIF